MFTSGELSVIKKMRSSLGMNEEGRLGRHCKHPKPIEISTKITHTNSKAKLYLWND